MPEATETLSDSTEPTIGMAARTSQRRRCKLAKSLAFCSQNPCEGTRLSHVIDRCIRFARRAGNKDTVVTQFHDGRGKVGNRHHRHGFRRARGSLGGRRRHPGRTVTRHDHGLHAGSISRTQTGAEIARIRDAVQNKQQRAVCDLIEQISKIKRVLAFCGNRRNALMGNCRATDRQGAQHQHS